MFGAVPEAHERDIGTLPCSDGPDVLDVDLASDYLMAKGDNYRRHQGQAVLPFVRDQNAQMLGLTMTHLP